MLHVINILTCGTVTVSHRFVSASFRLYIGGDGGAVRLDTPQDQNIVFTLTFYSEGAIPCKIFFVIWLTPFISLSFVSGFVVASFRKYVGDRRGRVGSPT